MISISGKSQWFLTWTDVFSWLVSVKCVYVMTKIFLLVSQRHSGQSLHGVFTSHTFWDSSHVGGALYLKVVLTQQAKHHLDYRDLWWCRHHIRSHISITPLIRVKKSPAGVAAITTHDFIPGFHHLSAAWDSISPHVSTFGILWGNEAVKRADIFGITYKYCWCPIFQVNKQQPASSAAFGTALIRLSEVEIFQKGSPVIPFFLRTNSIVRGPDLNMRVCRCVSLCYAHQYSSTRNMHFFSMGSGLAVKVR